jgi:serpin B
MKGRNISRENFRVGLAAAVLCVGTCQSSTAVPAVQKELALANTGFAFNLLKQLNKEQPRANIFISPYSASTVLQMVGTGAAGTTLTEMEKALGTSSLTEAAVEQGNEDIAAYINAKNTNFILTTANSIWYLQGMPPVPAFIDNDEKYFGATVKGLNFAAPSAVALINNWASTETHGKITKIIATIPPDMRMILANAVYFLGSWQNPFDTNLTASRSFYPDGGGQSTIPMMQQTRQFIYSETSDYQAVELPYKGGDLAMYVFLPSPNSSLEQLLSAMNAQTWQETINNDFGIDEGTLTLPKFNLTYDTSLIPALQALGMRTAFTTEANFSKISSERLYIGMVKQQAMVEVNELGTEAAAVTTVGLLPTVVPYFPNPFQMVVNRPFLFFIEDQQTATILFSGAIFNP